MGIPLPTLGGLSPFIIRTFVLRILFNGDSARPDEVHQLPSRDQGRTIKAYVYHSKAINPTPVLINLHGSGFVIPWHGTDDEFARRVASETDYTVLDIAYRLSPEYPYPAAIQDLEDVVNWVFSKPEQFDLTHVSLSGFSAGGTLALAASSQLLAKGSICQVVAFYPPTEFDMDPGGKSAPEKNAKPAISPWLARFFTSCYLPPGVDPKDPQVSPLFGKAECFPPRTLIITCGLDSLCDEAEELVHKLRSVHGQNVLHQRMKNCNHAWDKMCKSGTAEEEAKNTAYDLVIKTLRH